MTIAGCNKDKPIIEIKHSDLKTDIVSESLTRECPTCHNGVICPLRSNDTFVFNGYDVCTLCGQRFKYIDIDQLRAADWANHST